MTLHNILIIIECTHAYLYYYPIFSDIHILLCYVGLFDVKFFNKEALKLLMAEDLWNFIM